MSATLRIAGLTRSFYGVPVLRGVELEVARGSLTGLIGPNGAGKTTLFNAISGRFRPGGWGVTLAGADVTGLSRERRVARGLVRSFQLARGFPRLSVFQHLMLHARDQPGEGLLAGLLGSAAARRREAVLAERALRVARRLRLGHVLDHAVTALSGGQKKLVEIGRALMAEPRLVLLDEPMAGVNPTLAGEIAEHLQVLRAEGVTICLIEHDMALIRRLCDPVIVLAEGRTLVSGSFATVAADPRVQDAYLGHRA